MSNYDKIFKSNISDIITKGTWTETRARWADTGEKAKAIHLFGIVNEYDLSDMSNQPIGTLRQFPIQNCIDEILWIWQLKSNNVKDLKSHIWDAWADRNGSIGSAYGEQVRSKIRKVMYTTDNQDGSKTTEAIYLDQTDYVLHMLKHDKFNRRIMTDLYSVGDVANMGLEPCCYGCTWGVTVEDGVEKLNLILNQRSQDMIVANNWNVFQYSILLHMFAQATNLKPGKLIHVIANAHIYDRHIPIAKELLARPDFDPPTLNIAKLIKDENGCTDFYQYSYGDFQLSNYQHGDAIKNIPVAE